jgi:hypothetical protein
MREWEPGHRVGRISWRKGEAWGDWIVRRDAYVEERDRKLREREGNKISGKLPYAQRRADTLAVAREKFGLTDEDITARYGSEVAKYSYLESIPIRIECRSPFGRADGLVNVRMDMVAWVTDTFHLKRSEALCDLDCGVCPRAMALNCAAQNRSAAEADGFLVCPHNPMEKE